MNEDKIHFQGSWEYYEPQNANLLHLQVQINGKPVNWNWVDVHSLAMFSMKHNPKEYKESKWSCFYLFSCSCGAAGCAGIWDGIHVKVRKNSVEWRVKKKSGYQFLDKQFYSFDRKQYTKALRSFFGWLYMNQWDFDHKVCVDLGHYDGGETTAEQFFEWLESIGWSYNDFV